MEPRIDDGYGYFAWSQEQSPSWPLNAYTLWLKPCGVQYHQPPREDCRHVHQGMPAAYHQTKWCADQAIAFMDQAKDFKQPWLFSFNCRDPHKGAFRMINVVSGIWQNTGWNSVVYLATLTSIDPQLCEAAKVDGAGRLRRIWHVSLPGLKQIVVLMLIMRIGSLMGTVTDKVLLLQNDLNLSVSELLGTYVYKMGMQKGKYSFATAGGLFNSVVNFILVILSNAISKRLSSDTHGIF